MRGLKKILSKVWLSLTALALVLSFVPAVLFSGAAVAAPIFNPTTNLAMSLSTTGAILNGTNGDYNASNTSFWWGTTLAGPFTPGTDPGNSSEFPAGWIHDNGLGAKSAGDSFSGVLTGLTPGTTYHFVAWSEVGETWYPGTVLNFTTDSVPAPILTLTVPATKTITRSVLVPETNGVPTAGDVAVDTAVVGLTAIPVTLANTGNADSANVRISPIGVSSHIQLWAKDTAGHWFDINVTGYIGSAGKSIPAGSSITTDVYAISDTTGDYPLTVNLVYVAGGTATTATGTVTVTPIIYTQADFKVFDGVNIGTNSYTVSSGITATYTGSNTIKLTGYAPIVIPWFWQTLTTYNYVTIGIKLPAGFTETSVYDAGVMRYNPNPSGTYDTGEGSTLLATTGAAKGYLDFSFAANSTNTKKAGLVKLQVIWNANSEPEYFTIDITDLQLGPDAIPPTATVTHDETAKTITYAFNEPVQLRDAGGNVLNSSTYASSLAVYDSVAYLAHIPGAPEPEHAVTVSSAILSSDAKSIVITYTGSLIKNAGASYVVDAWGKNITDLAGNKMAKSGSQIFMVTGDTTAPDVPTLVSPANGVFVKPAGLILDWSDVTDSEGSNPVTYVYRSSYSSVVGADNMLTSKLYERDNISESKIDASGSSDNTYYWQVRACDSLSNCSDWSGPWKVTIDRTKPDAPTINQPGEGEYFSSTPITATWTAVTTDPSGIVTYQVGYVYDDHHTFSDSTCTDLLNGGCRDVAGNVTSRNHTPGLNEQGGVTIYVRAIDGAGNVGPWSAPVYYYYDATAPDVPVIVSMVSTAGFNISNNSYTNSYSVTTSWTDSSSDVDHYEYKYWNNIPTSVYNAESKAWHTITSSTSLSGVLNQGEGTHYVEVRAIDNAGNTSGWSAPFVVTYDATAPSVQITAPTSTLLNGTVTISGVVVDANPDHYYLVVKNSNGNVIAGPGVVYAANVTDYNWDTMQVDDGIYTVDLEARDAADNKDSNSVQTLVVTVDNHAPNITIVGSTTVTVEKGATYTDAGATALDAIDGDLTANIVTGNSVDTKTVGVYTVTYNVSDTAGNDAVEVTRTVNVVDTTPPVITLNGGDITLPVARTVTVSPALRTFGGATFVAGAIAPTPTPSVTPTTTPTTIVDSNQTSDDITKVEGVSDTGSNLWWVWVLAALAVGGGLWWILAKRRVGEDE